MSKVKNTEIAKVDDPVALPAPTPPVPITKLTEEDKLALEVAKARRETALAQAKEALAKNETAELAYKYVTLQLFMKYGLTASDAIGENGDLLRGGAIAVQGK